MGWFGNSSEAERRRINVRLLYDFEMECREQGWGDPVFTTRNRPLPVDR
jgi:hypothetical protein